ncbi:unnamed protein product [Allacma fusca]|uniref:Uncharacterized protein n=1 Tax=Allacma fusca TaxID=39272 RepID=A0A8J2KZ34_9HEXA|nr:unnamed protein product [Allacma fusca]
MSKIAGVAGLQYPNIYFWRFKFYKEDPGARNTKRESKLNRKHDLRFMNVLGMEVVQVLYFPIFWDILRMTDPMEASFIIQHGSHVSCIETTAEVEKLTGADENLDGPEGGTSQKPKNCPVGHFECLSDSSLCVPQASICNSRADCPDNSDEAGCQNQHDKNFWDSLFYKRPGEEVEDMEEVTCKYKLTPNPEVKVAGELRFPAKEKETGKHGKKLRFSRTSRKIEDMEENKMSFKKMSPAWDSMLADDWVASTEAEWETECLCVSEKLFCQNLHSANLSSIPRDVEFLDLDGSRVNLQDFSRIAFPQLESLILSRGFIEDIHPGAFSRLRKLATLHLTNNRLSSIPSETFVGSPNLHSLFLGYNQLTSLHSDSFAGLTSLRELDLRHNKISEIPTDVFAPLVFLRKLHLSHNEVKSISSVLFQGLNRLEMLSLSGNSIATIHEGTFENLTSLQGLFLSWNKLTVLEDRIFCNLHSLLNLNLKDNEIVRIDTGAFSCLNRLESLNLERNRFGELDKPRLIFENLTKLQHMSMRPMNVGMIRNVILWKKSSGNLSPDFFLQGLPSEFSMESMEDFCGGIGAGRYMPERISLWMKEKKGNK